MFRAQVETFMFRTFSWILVRSFIELARYLANTIINLYALRESHIYLDVKTVVDKVKYSTEIKSLQLEVWNVACRALCAGANTCEMCHARVWTFVLHSDFDL